jgi:pilus assembly protein Flp/PilA
MPIQILIRRIAADDGTTAVEYAVMLALIILMCITAITTVGGQTFNYWDNNKNKIDAAMAARP